MRTIERRLRKLEESFARKKNDQGLSPGEQILARRRRRAEAAGEPFVDEPIVTYPKGLTVVDILRWRFRPEEIRARRRRGAVAAGEPFVEEPTESVTDCENQGRPVFDAEQT